jgi:hypothetical protein
MLFFLLGDLVHVDRGGQQLDKPYFTGSAIYRGSDGICLHYEFVS